jgi:hypothetical protein
MSEIGGRNRKLPIQAQAAAFEEPSTSPTLESYENFRLGGQCTTEESLLKGFMR